MSLTLLKIFLESIIAEALEDQGNTVSIEGRTITNLLFADDTDGLEGNKQELGNLTEHFFIQNIYGLWYRDQC